MTGFIKQIKIGYKNFNKFIAKLKNNKLKINDIDKEKIEALDSLKKYIIVMAFALHMYIIKL